MSKFASFMRRSAGVVVALTGIAFLSVPASAATMEGASSTTSALKFGGDLRLRHESIFNKTAGQVDRHRERLRLRFGVEAAIEKFSAGLALASGSGEQVSTNQSMTNGFSGKGIFIDLAYVSYKPMEWIKATGGKMKNPFWKVYSGDLMWDSDVNPEGFAQQASLDAGDMFNLFGNFAQMPMNENNTAATSDKDPWMFGNQVGFQSKLGGGVRWDFALANYTVMHEDVVAPVTGGGTVNQGDNTRAATGSAVLGGQFNIMQYTTQLGFQAGVPVRIQGDWVRNIHKRAAGNQKNGYQVGVILGSAKTAGSWEVAYFNKYLEADATLSDLSDSDWGAGGGTNRKGHIIWLAYAPLDYLTFQAKYMMTKRLNPYFPYLGTTLVGTTYTPRDTNRLQLDMVVKF